MKKTTTTNDKYDLKNWSHSSEVELKSFKKAIEKHVSMNMKLNPKIVKWAKREALKK